MLFSSLEFLLLFLPLVMLAGPLVRRYGNDGAVVVLLLAANLFFYGWFRWSYLPLLVGSIVFNYLVGRYLIGKPNRSLLALGVAANLALLGFYKYAGFFSTSLGFDSASLNQLILPLAISFYTFQQISFVVDCYRGEIKQVGLLNYALYVSFFPQLIAGPIVRFAELYPQLPHRLFRADADMLARGLTLFLFGLAKKVIVADVLSRPVDAVWGELGSEAGVATADAWFACIAYSFQIYFDFSAYSDMAIGLGLMMGVTLPVNFLSPYRATSIRDFWQRWHMTLSRWLRDYLYIVLGGNRHGKNRQVMAIFVTMALGGLWHGAGWNFVLWGVLHGVWIALSHLRRGWGQTTSMNEDTPPASRLRAIAGVVLTFVGVTVLWIFFRGEQGAWLQMFSALFSNNHTEVSHFENFELAIMLIGAIIVFTAPANARIFGIVTDRSTRLGFRPSLLFALTTACLFFVTAMLLVEGKPNAFIYFQF